jgi:hypothetical protein
MATQNNESDYELLTEHLGYPPVVCTIQTSFTQTPLRDNPSMIWPFLTCIN